MLFILLTRFQYHGRKFGVVRRIREVLGFETECAPERIGFSSFSNVFPIQEIS